MSLRDTMPVGCAEHIDKVESLPSVHKYTFTDIVENINSKGQNESTEYK